MMRVNQVKHLYVRSDAADIPLELAPSDKNITPAGVDSKLQEDTQDDVIVKDQQPDIEMRENKSRKRSRGKWVVS